ncbi:unnamed protein product [Debaryomyces tyrocola]|nr:unnamed protein product [Debaryomyces tyrocola]
MNANYNSGVCFRESPSTTDVDKPTTEIF